MATLETVKSYAYKKIWGEHSLSLGELIAFIVGLLVIWFNWLGKWSFWVGVIIIFLGMMLF
jgi:hypothetical protein